MVEEHERSRLSTSKGCRGVVDEAIHWKALALCQLHRLNYILSGWGRRLVGTAQPQMQAPRRSLCEANVSVRFLRSEVCCFLIGPFSSAKEVNESIPETCQQVCVPHLFTWDLSAESHLWDEEPSAIHTVPGLWVCSQSMITLQARARAGTTPSSECPGMCKCGHANGETEPSCAPVCPWVWKSDTTALISQSCCVGKARESKTSGKE